MHAAAVRAGSERNLSAVTRGYGLGASLRPAGTLCAQPGPRCLPRVLATGGRARAARGAGWARSGALQVSAGRQERVATPGSLLLGTRPSGLARVFAAVREVGEKGAARGPRFFPSHCLLVLSWGPRADPSPSLSGPGLAKVSPPTPGACPDLGNSCSFASAPHSPPLRGPHLLFFPLSRLLRLPPCLSYPLCLSSQPLQLCLSLYTAFAVCPSRLSRYLLQPWTLILQLRWRSCQFWNFNFSVALTALASSFSERRCMYALTRSRCNQPHF